MNIRDIPLGNNIPNDIYVIIEISADSRFVKYEMNKKYNVLFVDRFINCSLCYPCNYGYLNNTLSFDGDCLDVLVLSLYPLIPGSVIHSRPIGLLKMVDESGDDNKVLSVPNFDVSKEYNDINSVNDISINLLDKISYFFENYKKLENDKWSKILGWGEVDLAKKLILSTYDNFLKKNNIN